MMNNYQIVTDPTESGMAEKIVELMEDGWQAQGGVAVAVFPGKSSDSRPLVAYAQAMVKKETTQ